MIRHDLHELSESNDSLKLNHTLKAKNVIKHCSLLFLTYIELTVHRAIELQCHKMVAYTHKDEGVYLKNTYVFNDKTLEIEQETNTKTT